MYHHCVNLSKTCLQLNHKTDFMLILVSWLTESHTQYKFRLINLGNLNKHFFFYFYLTKPAIFDSSRLQLPLYLKSKKLRVSNYLEIELDVLKQLLFPNFLTRIPFQVHYIVYNQCTSHLANAPTSWYLSITLWFTSLLASCIKSAIVHIFLYTKSK